MLLHFPGLFSNSSHRICIPILDSIRPVWRIFIAYSINTIVSTESWGEAFLFILPLSEPLFHFSASAKFVDVSCFPTSLWNTRRKAMHIPVVTERFFGMFVQFSFPSPFIFQPVFHNFPSVLYVGWAPLGYFSTAIQDVIKLWFDPD